MELALKRIQSVKSLLTIVEQIITYDSEEAYKIIDITEIILKRAKDGLKDGEVQGEVQGEGQGHTISVEELENMFAGTEPPKDDTSVITGTTSMSRRNFTCWAKTLNLPAGHSLYFGDVVFKLSYDKKNRATLTTQIRNGKTIVGYSPSGVIKAYLNSIGSVQKNVDGWKRLTMELEGEKKEIGWIEWLQREWSVDQFRKLDMLD
jgi:hypothetical protein